MWEIYRRVKELFPVGLTFKLSQKDVQKASHAKGGAKSVPTGARAWPQTVGPGPELFC